MKHLILSVVVGFFLILLCAHTFKHYLFVRDYKKQYSILTRGEIKSVYFKKGASRGGYYIYSVDYCDQKKELHTVQNYTELSRSYSEGDSLPVRYKPSDAREAMIDDPAQTTGYLNGSIFFIILTTLFLTFAIIYRAREIKSAFNRLKLFF